MSSWVVEVDLGKEHGTKRVELRSVDRVERSESGQVFFYTKPNYGNEQVCGSFFCPIGAWDSEHAEEFGSAFDIETLMRWVGILDVEAEPVFIEKDDDPNTMVATGDFEVRIDSYAAARIADFLQSLIDEATKGTIARGQGVIDDGNRTA